MANRAAKHRRACIVIVPLLTLILSFRRGKEKERVGFRFSSVSKNAANTCDVKGGERKTEEGEGERECECEQDWGEGGKDGGGLCNFDENGG